MPALKPPMKNVTSPCIDVCKMDSNKEFCLGCHRTIPEIRDWKNMSETDRRTLLNKVAARQKARDALNTPNLTTQSQKVDPAP